MLDGMTETGANPNNDSDSRTLPGAESPANFARHDVDPNAPDDARLGDTEQGSFDRHDVDPDAPDAVHEDDQATFERHDVNPNAPDAVDESRRATYDRHDTDR